MDRASQELIESARRDPEAKTMADLVGWRQLTSINKLCRQLRLNPDSECRKVLGCEAGALSKTAATAFIFYLETLAKEQAA